MANATVPATNSSARAGLSWDEIVRELHGAVYRIKQDAWLQWGLLTGLSGTLTIGASLCAYMCVKRKRCCRRRRRQSAYRLQDSRVSSSSSDPNNNDTADTSLNVSGGGSNDDAIYENISLGDVANPGTSAAAAAARDNSSSDDSVSVLCAPVKKSKRH